MSSPKGNHESTLLAKNVFIIGPGFIGWVVLDLLVKKGYTVTAFCRRKEHGEAIKRTGASRVVYGDLRDSKAITKETSQNDVIIHTATADDLPSVQAVVDGIYERASQGKSTIYIHTSGTSVLDDNSKGEFKGEKIYTDKDPAAIDSLPDNAPHRPIDLYIVRAQRKLGGKAKIAIMIPPEIYGYNEWNQRLTIQIPKITKFALQHGFAGYVGKGLGVESQIHVNDLGRGYITLLHYIESCEVKELLENPYFFCENGEEFSWIEVAQEIGKGLFAAGKINDPKPKPFNRVEYDDLFGENTDSVIGLNSRSRAERLRELGWRPIEKSIWESYHQDELPAMLSDID